MDLNYAKYVWTSSAPHLFKHTTFFSEVVFLSSTKNNKEWISCCVVQEKISLERPLLGNLSLWYIILLQCMHGHRSHLRELTSVNYTNVN
jgi:hypothetical protein